MGEFEDEETTRLDGNAAAGVLTQVFCGEPSGALIVCAGCGATSQSALSWPMAWSWERFCAARTATRRYSAWERPAPRCGSIPRRGQPA